MIFYLLLDDEVNFPEVRYFLLKLMFLKTANRSRKTPHTTMKIFNMHFTRKGI